MIGSKSPEDVAMPSIVITSTRTRGPDHFEPEAALDPQEQRKLPGYLGQIDYAAFAANQEIVAKAIGQVDLGKFQRLAVAAAHARAQWVSAALAMTANARALTLEQTNELAALRSAFDELADVYEAMRRMVERGYLSYTPTPQP
jgi:hypothetical protein